MATPPENNVSKPEERELTCCNCIWIGMALGAFICLFAVSVFVALTIP
jgi:hypothetical protein